EELERRRVIAAQMPAMEEDHDWKGPLGEIGRVVHVGPHLDRTGSRSRAARKLEDPVAEVVCGASHVARHGHAWVGRLSEAAHGGQKKEGCETKTDVSAKRVLHVDSPSPTCRAGSCRGCRSPGRRVRRRAPT